jgi:leucyl/phenylalanyl-tRNA--protein transferase
LWWCPNPRAVIFPDQAHISKSLKKLLRKNQFRITFDHAFTQVIQACAAPREYTAETWISKDIIQGYTALHERGIAHSVEVWAEQDLVGGLYGVALGQVFYGESMFSRTDNASKIAFAFLIRELLAWNFQLIDCQVGNEHTESLGAVSIPRNTFQKYLIKLTKETSQAPTNWANHVVCTWSD